MNDKDLKSAYDQHHSSLVILAKKMVGDLFCDDIVQEAFFQLHKRGGHESPRSFLFLCVRNKCLNHIKHLKRKGRTQEILGYEEFLSEDRIEADIIRSEYCGMLLAAINKLPPGRKKVLELHYSGYDNVEVAELLNISASTVGVQIKRFIDSFGLKKIEIKGKKFCKHGHLLTEKNTGINSHGSEYCKTCCSDLQKRRLWNQKHLLQPS